MQLRDEATLALRMESNEFDQKLKEINEKAKSLKATLKEIEQEGGEGSEKWAKYRVALKDTEEEAKKFNAELKQMDIGKMTMGQLINQSKQLSKELRGAVRGSTEYVNTAKRLGEVEREIAKTNKETERLRKNLDEVEAEALALVQGMKSMNVGTMNMKQLTTHARHLNDELSGMQRGTIKYVETAKRLGEVEREMKKAADETKKLKQGGEDLAKPSLWQKITSGVNSVGGAFKAIMALQVIGYIVEIGRTIFEATAKMEKFEKVLTTALGDNRLAKESLAAIKQMAKDTVFTVEELTDGYVKMVNRGLRPSKQEMIALADLAASQGKTFDQLVEAALDAQTGEMERLKEFGIRAKKSGEDVTFTFKDAETQVKKTAEGYVLLDKNGKQMLDTFNSQDEAIYAAITNFGTLDGVHEMNSKMMDTLDGKNSNLQDSFFDLASTLGEDLKPAFFAIFDLINSLLPVLSFMGKVIATVIISGKGLITSFIDTLTSAFKGIGSLYDAGKALLQGNIDGAKYAYEKAERYGNDMTNAAKVNGEQARKEIAAIWSDPDAKIKAEFAGKAQGEAYQTRLTEEQVKGQKERKKEAEKAAKEELKQQQEALEAKQKANKEAAEKAAKEELKQQQEALEAKQKANKEAIDSIIQLEEEAFVAKVKLDEGEFEAEKVILQQKLRHQLEKLEESLANQEQKEKLKVLLIDKYHREIAIIEEKARKKKEEDEEKNTEKLYKLRLEELEHEKKVLKLEQEAHEDILRFKELSHKKNSRELVQIRKDHLDEMLDIKKKQLKNELDIEEAKIKKEIKNTDDQQDAIKQLYKKFNLDILSEEEKTAAAKAKVDQDYWDGRADEVKKWSSSIRGLLKGDFKAFGDQITSLGNSNTMAMASTAKGMADEVIETWNQLWDTMGKIAIQATEFLAELATLRAEKEIREVERAWKHREKVLDQELEKATEIMEEVMARRDRIAEETGEKVTTTKEREAEKLKSLEELMATIAIDNSNLERDQKIANAEAVLAAEIAAIEANANYDSEKKAEMIAAARAKSEKEIELARTEAEEKKAIYSESIAEIIAEAEAEKNEKITKAEATREAVLAAIEWERSEKVIASEAIRDAQIRNIQERQDLDDATRTKMIEDVKAAATIEIDKVNEVAAEKARTANETADTAISEAKREEADKIEITNALIAGDKEKAEAIMSQAKIEATEKIAQAERERIEKLKEVEKEKAEKIIAKQELERQLYEEQKAAKIRVWELEMKMFHAQQKADIAIAHIQGAVAAMKALASTFFPLNMISVAGSAAQTAIQVKLIKEQLPPEMPDFRYGGIIRGGKHGSSYGLGGIAMIDRISGREVGEMEGEEYIVPADQTAVNLPFLQEMSRRSRAGVREPINNFRAFKHGGFVNYPMWRKQMFLYGGQVNTPTANDRQLGDNEVLGGNIVAEYRGAIETGNQQLELIRGMNVGIGMLNEKMERVINNTGANVAATRSVEGAIYATNSNSRIDTLIGAISNLGKAA